MEEEKNTVNVNVQQGEALIGHVNNQARKVLNIVGEAVNQPTADEQQREDLLKILEETRIRSDTEVPPEEYTLEVDGKGIFALRDIHAVKAKAKAGKTTTLKVFIAALLAGVMFRVKSLLEKPRILYFDTEQNRHDTKLIIEDVARMTELPPDVIDGQVSLHSLRRIDRGRLLPLLTLAIEEGKPDVVFIDGIVEYVASFNDETESKALIQELLRISDTNNCAIVCVLHTNKADEDHNMRGHLGSMLAQKSATVLECRKERGSSIITVSCSESRHQEMPEWSITFDEEGRIVNADSQRRMLQEQRRADLQQKRRDDSEKERQKRLEQCLRVLKENGGATSRKYLTENLVKVLNRERSTVASYISGWIKDEAVMEEKGVIKLPNDQTLPF